MGLFDSVASLGTSFIDRQTQARENRRARDYGREMADYTFQKDLEMWNMQNEYNSPANQMMRFKEAGLNPHLIYGQGSSGNANGAPSYNTPQGHFGLPPFRVHGGGLDEILQFQDIRMKQANIDSIKAMTKNALKELDLKAIRENLMLAELDDWYDDYNENKQPVTKGRLSYNSDYRKQMLQQMANNIWWGSKKNELFDYTGVNIDRDGRWDRLISEKLGGEMNSLMDRAIKIVFGKK